MKSKKTSFYIAAVLISIVAFQACRTYYFRSNYRDVNMLLHESSQMQTKLFLKAHLKDGEICILRDSWAVDTLRNIVTGTGSRFDFNRTQTFEGSMSIPIDSVAIFETNSKIINPEAGRIAALSVMAGVEVIVGLICLTNPKACFGSCPTFYMNDKEYYHYADAEGFSNAISPSMEYADIDALNNKPISNGLFSITMKNEALETHCVNDVKLLAYPRKAGERVFQTPENDFYLCGNKYPVSKARATEGDITGLLKNEDIYERFSLADESNLSSREELFVNFSDVKNSNDLGLIISFRQTLMTTYLFYSSMGYMGDNVSDVFSILETDSKMRNKFDATTKELGNIDVYVWNETKKQWELQDRIYETGPIAINRQFLPLKTQGQGSDVKLKLVMNKGLWRIDYLALTNIKEKVKPIEISAGSILNKGKADPAALASMGNPDEHLISMPGSEYKFNFTLPDKNADYELFLYSKGYYLEWMREHWIKDKDLLKLQQMVYQPKDYLKAEAKAYKRYENEMEQEFWNSKVDTKTFSYYEN
ncbi:MAG: hypothetical protein IPH88_18685 [Bacteroidales bacterium]|nr:hypothetical protein [Bacteroidales bacterium]